MSDVNHGESEACDESLDELKKFLQDGCGCTLGPKNGPCCRQFPEETVLFNVNNCESSLPSSIPSCGAGASGASSFFFLFSRLVKCI